MNGCLWHRFIFNGICDCSAHIRKCVPEVTDARGVVHLGCWRILFNRDWRKRLLLLLLYCKDRLDQLLERLL